MAIIDIPQTAEEVTAWLLTHAGEDIGTAGLYGYVRKKMMDAIDTLSKESPDIVEWCYTDDDQNDNLIEVYVGGVLWGTVSSNRTYFLYEKVKQRCKRRQQGTRSDDHCN